jgi:transketolase
MAVGMALGARTLKKSWRTYCVVGDGECNEGSIWEAAMAAAHYKLGSLLVIVDRNHLMIDGPTEEVMSLEPLADKWKAFGWEVTTVDGHNLIELSQAVESGLAWGKGPFVIIANTVKGKGVDFMENQPGWHYGGLNSDLIARAKASIGGE